MEKTKSKVGFSLVSRTLSSVPLNPELSQRILFDSFNIAMRDSQIQSSPASLGLNEMKSLVKYLGSNSLLVHPAIVQGIFDSVTFSVYTKIADLFCDRLARSVDIVFEILTRKLNKVNAPSVSYEAVWAICVSLRKRYLDKTQVTIDRGDSVWWLTQITLRLQNDDPKLPKKSFVCVIDPKNSRVMTFRLSDLNSSEEIPPLVLYDAIVGQRCPDRAGIAGLRWTLPQKLFVDSNVFSKSMLKKLDAFEEFFPCELFQLESPLLSSLKGNWLELIKGTQFTGMQLINLFDTFLQNIHGFGPIRQQRKKDRQCKYSIGYSQDPCTQFPALRLLLMSHDAEIQGGAIEFGGLHYEHELLPLFDGEKVIIKRSEQAESRVWVYLGDQILCEAWARELRRSDGNYRPFRFRKQL